MQILKIILLNKMFSWIKRLFNSFISQKTKIENSTNVVESIAKAKALYKELIIKAHPDKHPNNILLAKELTEMLNQNRYNYSMLMKVRERMEKELYLH